jgi:solute carrier family 25 carnitine/acylcarnitine transporter 20/29
MRTSVELRQYSHKRPCSAHSLSLTTAGSGPLLVPTFTTMPSRRLLAAALFALLSLPSHAAQIPLAPDSPTPVSTTLVDVLSADPDYTSLLRLLQRARLIPTLNQLNNTIIFAPTNDAIKRRRERDSFWLAATSEDEAYTRNDNVQEVLRQELFYHMLDCTNSTCDLSSNSNPTVHRTLHYPRQSTEGPSQGPPSSPPWMPRPGGTLGGEPQRLRTHSRESELWAGVEASGDGGVKVVKDQQRAVNGAVVGIEDVLTVPSDLGRFSIFYLLYHTESYSGSIIAKQDSLSYFNRIMTDHLANLLNDTNATTLFLPVDSAWESLHPVEKLYLESEFASDDLQKIFTLHAVTNKGVTWLDSLEDELKRKSLYIHVDELTSCLSSQDCTWTEAVH